MGHFNNKTPPSDVPDLKGLYSFQIVELVQKATPENLQILLESGLDLGRLECWDVKNLAAEDQQDKLRLLLTYGLDLKGLDSLYIREVAQKAAPENLQILLESGLDLKVLKSWQVKELVKESPLDKLKLLLAYGLDLKVLKSWQVKELVKESPLDKLKLLLTYGFNLKQLGPWHTPGLAEESSLDTLEYLLSSNLLDLGTLAIKDREQFFKRITNSTTLTTLAMCSMDGTPVKHITTGMLQLAQCQHFLNLQSHHFPNDTACGYRLPQLAWELFGAAMSDTSGSIAGYKPINNAACSRMYDAPKDVLMRFTYCNEERSCLVIKKQFDLYENHPVAGWIMAAAAVDMLGHNKMNDSLSEQGIVVYKSSCNPSSYKTEGGEYWGSSGLIHLKHTTLAYTGLIHELTHKVMHVVFDKDCNPPNIHDFSKVIIEVLSNIKNLNEERLEVCCANTTVGEDSDPEAVYGYGKSIIQCLDRVANVTRADLDYDFDRCSTRVNSSESKLELILNGTSTANHSGLLTPFTSKLYTAHSVHKEFIAYAAEFTLTGSDWCWRTLAPFYQWFDDEFTPAAKAYIENSECCANIRDFGIAGITCVHPEPCPA